MKKVILFLIAASLCFAWQDDKPQRQKYYRIDFAVKELEAGKVQSTKNYSVINGASGGTTFMVRAGDKVAVPVGGNPASSQFTYLDVGVSIDCKYQWETATDVALQIAADVSSVVSATSAPSISQTKWSSFVLVPLKKATTVFSSDSAGSKRTTQLEVTITPLP